MRYQKEKLCISIDSTLLHKLKDYAASESRSLSGYINFILKSFVESQEIPVLSLPSHPENRRSK